MKQVMEKKKGNKISIIVICYNNYEYIFESLRSIIGQTYDNIELIISDDGSTYFNKEEVERYLADNPKSNIKNAIININAVNVGTVKHLEALYRICSGELVTVIAADDAYADSFAIENLVSEYEKYNGKIRVVTSLIAMCDHKLKKIKSIFTKEDDVKLINSGDTQKLFEELSWRCIMPSSGTIVERTVYDEIGKLSEKYDLVEDWSSHLIFAREGIPIRCVDKVTVKNRDGGVSHGNTKGAREVFLRYYKDLLSLYEYEVEPYLQDMSTVAAQRAKKYYEGRKIKYKEELLNYKKENCPKIAFYFRKGVIAKGDFSLYYRIADILAREYNYDVYCINNSNPELQMKYYDSDIRFCNINEQTSEKLKDATFITAVNQVFFLLDEISQLKNAKILLLFLHPQITKWLALQGRKNKFDIEDFIGLLVKGNAYGFMDEANVIELQKKVSISFEKRFFPVLLDGEAAAAQNSYANTINKKGKNIAWLGRLDKDKIYSLINFLDNYIETSDDEDVLNLHLIGGGNGLECINLGKYKGRVRIIDNSYLYGEERDEYLKKNVDLVVAMGMSALDCATIGLPVVLPIVSDAPILNDKLIYLYDTKNYCLGWSEEALLVSDCKTHTAAEIVDDIYGKGLKEEIGNACRQYAVANFSPRENITPIIRLIDGTTLTVKECMKNKTVRSQMTDVVVLRVFRVRNYGAYLSFKQKIERFKKLSFKQKIKKIFSYAKRKIKKFAKKAAMIMHIKRK